MEREALKVHRLTDEDFQKSLTGIRKGEIPGNFADVVAHVKGTIKELMEFAEAITECALRLHNSNSVLRDILDKADVHYENTPDGPRKITGGDNDKRNYDQQS